LFIQVLPNGAVATDSQQCSQIGVNFLKKGGSAVDAVVASVFCLLVSNPHIISLGA
jgi:gamma-glutamyltranspeptidase